MPNWHRGHTKLNNQTSETTNNKTTKTTTETTTTKDIRIEINTAHQTPPILTSNQNHRHHHHHHSHHHNNHQHNDNYQNRPSNETIINKYESNNNRIQIDKNLNLETKLNQVPSQLSSPLPSKYNCKLSLLPEQLASSNRKTTIIFGRRPSPNFHHHHHHHHHHHQQKQTIKILIIIIIAIIFNNNHHHNRTTTTAATIHNSNYQPYNALIGQPISLPCNITPPTSDDDVSLILWYRDDLSTPIYTVDARGTSNLKVAKHFHDTSVLLSDRVSFNITYPISYLRFEQVIDRDTAEYRCRVDFRRDRTINRVMQLNVIVPAKKLSIYDMKNNYINDIAGPFNEDSQLNLTCESEGGNPLPKVKWWKGDTMISDRSNSPRKGVVHNVITFQKMLREHLMMPLTCESSNTNLTVPVTKTILIDLNLKPTEVRIVRPLHNMTVGQRIELVCQSSGSRPPAKITWRKNNKLIEHFSESTSDDGSVTTNFLAFIPTIEDNGKLLSCIAYNPQFNDFQLEDKLQLNIHYAPILSLLLGANAKQQEIIESSSVYFDCNIQANPPVQEFGWLFNGDELLQTHDQPKYGYGGHVKNKIEIRNNSIIINNVNSDHIGAYQCYASNPLGRTFSEVVNLHVKYAPICANEQEIHFQIELYEQLTIECQVRSDPKDVLFFWEFNSTYSSVINNGGDGDQESKDDNAHKEKPNQKPLMTIENEPESSILHFTPRSLNDFGTLYCFAQNRIGRQIKPCIFHISKSETPNAPQNCSLQNVTNTSLTVHCNSNNNSTFHLNSEHQPSSWPDQHFVLLIYNGLDVLICNITTIDQPLFHVSNLSTNDFDNLNLFVYAINQNGQSDKVRVPVNNLVGQPRKLEHIEQRINIKPFLLLMFIVACLVTSIGTFILLIIFRIRKRYKNNQNQANSPSKTITKNNRKMKKRKKNRTVFDTEIKSEQNSGQPKVPESNVREENGLLVDSNAYSSSSLKSRSDLVQSTSSSSLHCLQGNSTIGIISNIDDCDKNQNGRITPSTEMITIGDFIQPTATTASEQTTESALNHLHHHHHHHHCITNGIDNNIDNSAMNVALGSLDPTMIIADNNNTITTTSTGSYLELTDMNPTIPHHHHHHHHHLNNQFIDDTTNSTIIESKQQQHQHCHLVDSISNATIGHCHCHHHRHPHVQICSDDNINRSRTNLHDEPEGGMVHGELLYIQSTTQQPNTTETMITNDNHHHQHNHCHNNAETSDLDDISRTNSSSFVLLPSDVGQPMVGCAGLIAMDLGSSSSPTSQSSSICPQQHNLHYHHHHPCIIVAPSATTTSTTTASSPNDHHPIMNDASSSGATNQSDNISSASPLQFGSANKFTINATNATTSSFSLSSTVDSSILNNNQVQQTTENSPVQKSTIKVRFVE